jgi:hypothetical protein
MATQTAKSKLQDVKAPSPRRTLPNSHTLESQTDHQRNLPIIGREAQRHRPMRCLYLFQSCGSSHFNTPEKII